ncbi:MAG: HD domain-containing protein, partial [Solirubrobacterales bacterium]|nr:HD domain-containing protein [Solirubrobacterales bacterium]
DELRALALGGALLDEHELRAWSQPLGAGVCGRVATRGATALVHDAALDPDHMGPPQDAPLPPLRAQLAVPLRVDGRVWGVLSIEDARTGAFGSDDVLLLETVAAQVAEALHRSALLEELDSAFATTLGVLCDALEAKDLYTATHAHDVGELAAGVGERLGLGDAELRDLRYGALLHDIGKIAIPTEILNKPGPLTAEERAVMETHTIVGAQMLERIPFFAQIHPLVRASHERWDGAGYPDGLRGEAIPLGARIIGACDAFHAMTSDRPYRRARPVADAIAELERCAGTQFDARVVAALAAGVADVRNVGLMP